MLYWMNDETGKVIAREEGDHPGEKWFEISPDDYKANLHPLSRPTPRAADAPLPCAICGKPNEIGDICEDCARIHAPVDDDDSNIPLASGHGYGY